jgi:release factor glutamine methyltransferase
VNPLDELRRRWSGLPDKPDETPESTAQALLLHANGDPERFQSLIERRIGGEPLAYLIGKQLFMGIEMLAGPQALIPRKETEILCRGALVKLREFERDHVSVLDICCGAGNLGLALAANVVGAKVRGSDISADAVELANRNAAYLGLENRAAFHTGDLFECFNSSENYGTIDLIICNPPYISSARVDKMPREISAFEPRIAFDGGPFGVRVLTRLVREARRFLQPEGWLAFETGLGQGNSMRKLLESSGLYRNVGVLTDESGETRALLARAAEASV